MDYIIETAKEKEVKRIIEEADKKIKDLETTDKYNKPKGYNPSISPTGSKEIINLIEKARLSEGAKGNLESKISEVRKEAYTNCMKILKDEPTFAQAKALMVYAEWLNPDLKKQSEIDNKGSKERKVPQVKVPDQVNKKDTKQSVDKITENSSEYLSHKQDLFMHTLGQKLDGMKKVHVIGSVEKEVSPKKFDMKVAYPDSKLEQNPGQLSYSLNEVSYNLNKKDKSTSDKFDIKAAYPESKENPDYTVEVNVKFNEKNKDHEHEH